MIRAKVIQPNIKAKIIGSVVTAHIQSAVARIVDNPYQGDYTVVPKIATDIILPTAQKSMSRNVTVKEIPVYVTGNEAGGNTVIIGG